MPGPAIRFVFARRRYGQRLAAVFLRQAQHALVPGPEPIEALDHENADSLEVRHCNISARQTEGRREFQAEIFVLNASREIDAVGQYADLRLHNVRGGRGAVRHVPFFLPEQEGGFFLRARKRDPEFFILIDAKRCGGQIADLASDVVLVDGPSLHGARRSWLNAIGQELEGAHAVAANPCKKAVSIGTLRVNPLSQPAPDPLTVREEIVEDRDHRIRSSVLSIIIRLSVY